MRRLLLFTALLLGLTSCSGLQYLSVGRVREVKPERLSLSGAEISLRLDLANQNKKNITFEEAKATLTSDRRPLLQARLREPVKLTAQTSQTTTLPISIRLSGSTLLSILTTPNAQEKPGTLRIEGTLLVRKGDSRPKRIRFSRRIGTEEVERLTRSLPPSLRKLLSNL